MKNKNFIIIAIAICSISAIFYSFISKKLPEGSAASSYMMVDVVETLSAFDGKMIVTYPDGKMNETDLKNYYGGFVATKKIESNDKIILDQLNQLHTEGWEIVQITSNSGGLSLTRYILKKGQ